MPIQLDKILADISAEKALHPNYPRATKSEIDDAWLRVGKSNKLSVHEARSIFKVLQKKYEQEKSKRTPSWKLFDIMEKIHLKQEIKSEVVEDEADLPMEEDEEYEMLEVQEEEEQTAVQPTLSAKSTGSNSDGESPVKSTKSSQSPNASPVKEEKVSMLKMITKTTASSASAQVTPAIEEKKLLNNIALTSQRSATVVAQSTSAATAAALQKKGITLRKTTAGSIATAKPAPSKGAAERGTCMRLEMGKTIQLPESIKRKLSEEQVANTASQSKKANLAQAASQVAKGVAPKTSTSDTYVTNAVATPQTTTTTAQLLQVRQECAELASTTASTAGISLITIPASNNIRAELANGLVGPSNGPSSSTAATVASTSTNGYSPRIEEIDFRNDIIFENNTNCNGAGLSHKSNNNGTDIINLGNFDNSLPPTFFKNLCNSSRHEALGLYVANVMNRLQARSAAKLELGILRAIIDVQSDELEQ